MNKCLRQLEGAPAGRLRGGEFRRLFCRIGNGLGGKSRESPIEIKDAARFDKDVLGRHAPGAHLLRPRLACYTCLI
jgi:hypothetical protein